MNRIMLSRYITKLGYQATLVENGRQALEKLQGEPFDLVLLDVEMPEMDGYQVLEQLKADPRLRDIPVIMISAVEELESVVKCIGLGAQDYLPKPFNPVLLRARLTACLERKRLRDQEVDYLQQVGRVTAAAAAIKANTFQPESLDEVARRPDELGQLAQVFQEMEPANRPGRGWAFFPDRRRMRRPMETQVGGTQRPRNRTSRRGGGKPVPLSRRSMKVRRSSSTFQRRPGSRQESAREHDRSANPPATPER